MALQAKDDDSFVAVTVHQIERMFQPGFGRNKFFNRELFNYVLELATTDLGRLRQEVHAFAHDFGHTGWEVQVRADNSQPEPKVFLKVLTPTRTAEITVHKDRLEIHD